MIFLRPSRDPRRPAIPTIALTDLAVKHLKPVEGKRITYLDKSLKGFGVMVTPSGHASYVLTYGPERRRIKLGDVGVVKLADARAQARDRLSRHRLGLEKETGSPTLNRPAAKLTSLASACSKWAAIVRAFDSTICAARYSAVPPICIERAPPCPLPLLTALVSAWTN